MYLLDIVILQNTQASPADEDSLLSSIGNFIYNFVHIAMLHACMLLQFCMSLLCFCIYMVLLFTHVHVAS